VCHVSLVAVAYGSISACKSSTWLVKCDRPTIKSPGLVMLDHSLCVYCRSSLTHAFIWCSCQLATLTIQRWRVPIYVATKQKNCKCEGHEMPCPDHLEIPSLTLLAVMLNVFEAAHSPAAHVTLWWIAGIACHDRAL